MLTGPGLGLQQVSTCLRLWRRSETAISLIRIVSADIKNNMEVEAAMELQRHLDETGVHQVHTIYA